MNAKETQTLKMNLVALALFYGQNLQEDVLAMYVEDLADLQLGAVLGTLQLLRRDPKITRCPLPATVRSFIEKPKLDPRLQASDLARAMIAAIRNFGWGWSGMTLCAGEEGYWTKQGKLVQTFKEAVEIELGSLAYEVIRRRGGWQHFHDEFYASDPTQFYAQLRESIEATMALARENALDQKPALPKPVQSDLSIEDKASKLQILRSKMSLVGGPK
jgi:hypothetical protein